MYVYRYQKILNQNLQKDEIENEFHIPTENENLSIDESTGLLTPGASDETTSGYFSSPFVFPENDFDTDQNNSNENDVLVEKKVKSKTKRLANNGEMCVTFASDVLEPRETSQKRATDDNDDANDDVR